MNGDRDAEVVVVVLTALNLEHDAVRCRLRDVRRADHPAGTMFEIGWLRDGGGCVALGVTGAGNTAAAVVAERAIAKFRPRALVFVGIAGALDDDLALGDIIVATKVYAYHSGSIRSEGLRPRPRGWEVPHELDQIARHVHRVGSFRSMLPDGAAPAIHFRPIASGEVVVDNRDHAITRYLRSTYDDAAAVDMESAGAAQAGHLSGVPVLAVRAISDAADGTKHTTDRQGWQRMAAANAAALALAVAAEVCASDSDGVPKAAPPLPGQLPPRFGVVGRQTYLTRLDEILLRPAPDRPRIAVLTGMAGVGKTALAVHWAHRAAADFPDGLLYADGRGFGPDPPLPPHELLGGLMRTLGHARGAEQGTVDERAARFRTALSGRRILIVLDNIGSVDQIRPLIPGEGSCAMLVTSRERLRGLAVQFGAELVEVDPLPAGEARDLLRAAIGVRAAADPSATARLASRCGGLPLALRIAAERVTSLPGQSLGPLVDQLGADCSALDLLDTGDDPYSAVRTVFSWSYQGLAQPAATAFRRLSLHPGPTLGLPVAAALLNLPAAQAGATLRVLVNAHLLAEPAARRYVMHDLIRGYAQDLCAAVDDAATSAAAVRRMFDQYAHTADRAGRVIMPYRYRETLAGAPAVLLSFDRREAALRWFDLERHNLVELCRIDDPDLDSRRWRLVYILRDYFYLSKFLDGWLETHRRAVAGCERLGDRRAEGITRNNLGRALLEAGDLDGAAAQYRLAHTLLAESDDEQGTTDASANLASVLRRQGHPAEALRRLQEALPVYRRAELPRKIGITLRSIARAELDLGRLTDATAHAEQALAEFVAHGLDLDAAQTLNTLVRIRLRGGEHELAETIGHLAIEHCRRAGSAYEEARAWHLLGGVALATGHPDRTAQRWKKALSILRRIGAPMAQSVEADLAFLSP